MSNISASDSRSAVLACISAQFTLYFDGRFWVGVLEHHERHRGGDVVGQVITVRAARHVFGGEPSDVELYDFLLARGDELIDRAAASPPVPASRSAGSSSAPRPNPKRAARQAAKEAARAVSKATALMAWLAIAILPPITMIKMISKVTGTTIAASSVVEPRSLLSGFILR